MRRTMYLLAMTVLLAACSQGAKTALPITQPPATETMPASTATSVPPAPTESPIPPGNASSFPIPSAYRWVLIQAVFQSPTDIQFPDDGSGRMFVLEQVGRIRLVRDGQMAEAPVLDITSKVGSFGNEQGLLGLAFHPDFQNNPYLYINYTDTQGNTVIARYRMDGDQADPSSEKVLLHQDQPFPNHNGGVLTFGPEGYLYAGLGDGGSGGDPLGNGQNTGVLLGKILRIDVDHGDPYTIPPDNPFGNEIWEYGLRNPWRFSFDRATGDLYIADVGQNTWEEVDFAAKGQGGLNFGWNYREGAHNYRGAPPANISLAEPVAEYSHAEGGCSITGGYVYRGSMPEWQGIYLYGDYCSGQIWGMMRTGDPGLNGGWVSQELFRINANITTFGQDPQGEICFADRGGAIYKLQR